MGRILEWYIETVTGDGTYQGPTFCLDKDYALPGIVHIYAADAPDAADLVIDIKDDGVSIFTNRPILPKGQNSDDEWEDFNDSLYLMEKFSWVRLDIPQTGGAKRITVQLDLESPTDERGGDKEDED